MNITEYREKHGLIRSCNTLPSDIDEGIKSEVEILYSNWIETYESCQGGKGHSFPEPTIRFHGDISEGFRALDVALKHGLHVHDIRRVWSIHDKEPDGPFWEMTFYITNIIS
jgi:hypothetical protein